MTALRRLSPEPPEIDDEKPTSSSEVSLHTHPIHNFQHLHQARRPGELLSSHDPQRRSFPGSALAFMRPALIASILGGGGRD